MNAIETDIMTMAENAKLAASELSSYSSHEKEKIIYQIAQEIKENSLKIIAENEKDISLATDKNLSDALIDRLRLNKNRIEGIAQAVEKVSLLADPVGRVLKSWRVESGLTISRVAIPIGVVAIIYESRPNVTVDAAALCLKSGNAVILRGGSECVSTNKILVTIMQKVLVQFKAQKDIIQFIPTQDHRAVNDLLQLDQYIDVVVPRGGPSLIDFIRKNSRIPVFSHLSGLCHTYIHQDANEDMAVDIVINAKMRRTGICGATETLLIDEKVADNLLPVLVKKLMHYQCEIRGDKRACEISPEINKASNDDWSTEYLAAILSVKVVSDINHAIKHIHQFGSNHTEAIITDNKDVATMFQQKVNSAIVMHNCSTQFADGGEFGMGAEIGIATGKLHARGPVGTEQLTTFKYVVEGTGQVRP